MVKANFLNKLLDGAGVEWKTLGDVAEYSPTRVDAAELDATSFVGVDNLIADKGGRVDASYHRSYEEREPITGPRPDDQVNLTDKESRIMPVSGGGFEQCYNAQAAVLTQSMLVVAAFVTQATNDKQQVRPMLQALSEQPQCLPAVEAIALDTGYHSAANVDFCCVAGFEPLIASSREHHHPAPMTRFTDPPPLPDGATRVAKVAHRLKTLAGKKLYALRKQTVEPVFGIIKSVMDFRQFSMRGLAAAESEWNLVCLSWNLKRMAVLRLR